MQSHRSAAKLRAAALSTITRVTQGAAGRPHAISAATECVAYGSRPSSLSGSFFSSRNDRSDVCRPLVLASTLMRPSAQPRRRHDPNSKSTKLSVTFVFFCSKIEKRSTSMRSSSSM